MCGRAHPCPRPPGWRMVDHPNREHRRENPAGHVVETGRRQAVIVERGGEDRELVSARRRGEAPELEVVDASIGGGNVIANGQRGVGPDESLKPESLERRQSGRVLARVHRVDPVVGAHHRPHVPLLHRGAESGEIDLRKRPLGHLVADRIGAQRLAEAVDLLIVARVVLDLRDHVLALDATDLGGGQRRGQVWILAQRLGLASPLRGADDVDRRREQPVEALADGLGTERTTVGTRHRRIPGGGDRLGVGESGHVPVPLADPVGTVDPAQRRDPEPGIARAAVGDQRELFGRAHRRHHHVRPLAGREARAAPGMRSASGRRARGRDGRAGKADGGSEDAEDSFHGSRLPT